MATRQDIVDVLVEKAEKRELMWRLAENGTWDAGWLNGCYFRITSDECLNVRLENVGSRLTIESELTSELTKTVKSVYDEDEPSDDEKLKRILECLSD